MARIDSLIESLLCEKGTELRFETGAPVVLTLPQGPISPIRKVLDNDRIRTVIAELAPPDIARIIESGSGPATFPYEHAKGTVLVSFRPDRDRLVVMVTPGTRTDSATGHDRDAAPAAPPTSAPAPQPVAVPTHVPGGSAARDGAEATRTAAAPSTERQRPVRTPARSAGSTASRRKIRRRPALRQEAPEYDEEETDEPEDPADSEPVEIGEDVVILPPPSSMLPVVGAQRTSPAATAMDALLDRLIDRNGSDLHLSTGQPPALRIDGDLRPEAEVPAIPLEELTAMLYSILPARNRKEFERKNDTDCAWENARSRFRVNVFRERQGIGAVIRRIPNEIRSVEELGIPKHVLELCKLPKGLVLVTGPTGSGKSTTLAAMIDHINRTRTDHIITIEDPIEFVHPNKRCVVHQREVGVHTESFKTALRAALREDPDVVLVGEMRDLETVSIAIETAETGHLVFGTLHTNTAPSTVDRIIDQFPADRQSQVRTMLSETLKGVITQTLCKKKGGGRIAVLEILIVNNAISNLIREGKTFQIPSMMQTGRGVGMQTQLDTLFDLVEKKKVEPADALDKAVAKTEFRTMLERAGYRV